MNVPNPANTPAVAAREPAPSNGRPRPTVDTISIPARTGHTMSVAWRRDQVSYARSQSGHQRVPGRDSGAASDWQRGQVTGA